MKSCLSVVFIFLLFGLFIVANDSYFVVSEGQKAIVTRFGAPSGEVREPGLNFKTPFMEEVHYFDTRILKWDGAPNQITTSGMKREYYISRNQGETFFTVSIFISFTVSTTVSCLLY